MNLTRGINMRKIAEMIPGKKESVLIFRKITFQLIMFLINYFKKFSKI